MLISASRRHPPALRARLRWQWLDRARRFWIGAERSRSRRSGSANQCYPSWSPFPPWGRLACIHCSKTQHCSCADPISRRTSLRQFLPNSTKQLCGRRKSSRSSFLSCMRTCAPSAPMRFPPFVRRRKRFQRHYFRRLHCRWEHPGLSLTHTPSEPSSPTRLKVAGWNEGPIGLDRTVRGEPTGVYCGTLQTVPFRRLAEDRPWFFALLAVRDRSVRGFCSRLLWRCHKESKSSNAFESPRSHELRPLRHGAPEAPAFRHLIRPSACLRLRSTRNNPKGSALTAKTLPHSAIANGGSLLRHERLASFKILVPRRTTKAVNGANVDGQGGTLARLIPQLHQAREVRRTGFVGARAIWAQRRAGLKPQWHVNFNISWGVGGCGSTWPRMCTLIEKFCLSASWEVPTTSSILLDALWGSLHNKRNKTDESRLSWLRAHLDHAVQFGHG